jgi:hypothetical protein
MKSISKSMFINFFFQVYVDATVTIEVFDRGMGRVMAYDSLDDNGEPEYFFACGVDDDTKFDEVCVFYIFITQYHHRFVHKLGGDSLL